MVEEEGMPARILILHLEVEEEDMVEMVEIFVVVVEDMAEMAETTMEVVEDMEKQPEAELTVVVVGDIIQLVDIVEAVEGMGQAEVLVKPEDGEQAEEALMGQEEMVFV